MLAASDKLLFRVAVLSSSTCALVHLEFHRYNESYRYTNCGGFNPLELSPPNNGQAIPAVSYSGM